MFNAICPAVYQQLRNRTGMTQADLGTALGVSRMTVMRFESGRAQLEEQQELKFLDLAKCTHEEFAELVCEQLTKLIDRRVGIYEGEEAYQPTIALRKAGVLLKKHGTEISPALARALSNNIDTTQLMGLAFERNRAGLVELTRDCHHQLTSDQSPRAS